MRKNDWAEMLNIVKDAGLHFTKLDDSPVIEITQIFCEKCGKEKIEYRVKNPYPQQLCSTCAMKEQLKFSERDN